MVNFVVVLDIVSLLQEQPQHHCVLRRVKLGSGPVLVLLLHCTSVVGFVVQVIVLRLVDLLRASPSLLPSFLHPILSSTLCQSHLLNVVV